MGRSDVERLAWVYAALDSGLAEEIVRDANLQNPDIAKFVGVSAPSVWCYLHAGRRPRRAHALRIARLLEILEAMPRA